MAVAVSVLCSDSLPDRGRATTGVRPAAAAMAVIGQVGGHVIEAPAAIGAMTVIDRVAVLRAGRIGGIAVLVIAVDQNRAGGAGMRPTIKRTRRRKAERVESRRAGINGVTAVVAS